MRISINQKKIIFLFPLISPVFWVLGVNLFIYHLAALYSSLYYKNTKLPKFLVAIILYIFIYLFSVSMSISSGGVRTLGAIYNLSFWVMGVMIFKFFYDNYEKKYWDLYVSKLFQVSIFCGVLSYFPLVLWGDYSSFSLPSLLAFFIKGELPPLIYSSVQLKILVSDFIQDAATPRSSVLSVYPTALAALMMLTIPIHLDQALRNKSWRDLLGLIFAVFALYMASSRTAYAALALSIIILIYSYGKFTKAILILSVSLLGVVITVYFQEIMDKILSYRAGSSSHRMEMYTYAVHLTLKESPLIGIGFKPRIEGFNIPIGSHSTFIGSFVKTGIVGGIFFLVFILSTVFLLGKKYFLNKMSKDDVPIFASVISVIIWMLTEDIDAPQLVCFVFFMYLGVLYSRKDKVVKAKNGLRFQIVSGYST